MEDFKVLDDRVRPGRYICYALIIWGPILVIGIVQLKMAPNSFAIPPLLATILALWLAAATLLMATAIGAGLLALARVELASPLEHALFAMPLGLGAASLAILILGLLGWLFPIAILTTMFGLSLLAGRKLDRLISRLPQLARMVRKGWKESPIPVKYLWIAGFIMVLLSLMQAMLPPIGYDGLYYHLPIPRLYLEAGRIYPTPEFTPAGFPQVGEMLFVIGMAVGSNSFSQLINLAFAVLFVVATFSAGQRWAKPYGGWIAGGMLLGMPIISTWAAQPNVDFAWALFEFLGVYALLLWGERMKASLAVLAGIMFGFALGTKYLALGGLLFVALATVFVYRRRGWQPLARLTISLVGIAALVALPWYLRNWIWYSNPVYPFFNALFNPASGPLARMSFLVSGVTLNPLYQLLLPLNLFVNRGQFVGEFGDIEFLNPLFLLIFAFPWTRNGKSIDRLVFITFMRYIFWSLTHSSFIRYLLPMLPAFGIISAHVIQELPRRIRFKRAFGAIVMSIGIGLVTVSLAVSIFFFMITRSWSVLAGWESRGSYLSRRLPDYAAIQYVNDNLSANDAVLMIFNARGYYCERSCIPDLLQTRWLNLLGTSPTASSVNAALQGQGITHLLYTQADGDYLRSIDPTGAYAGAISFLHEEFIPRCAEVVYDDGSTAVYEITCGGQ